MYNKVIRIGSRESRLAIIQSKIIMEQIQKIVPDVRLELVTMKTTGDKILNKTLDQIGGKGLFLKELDMALKDRKVDLCVHSLKDMPVNVYYELTIGAYSSREMPMDVLVLPEGIKEINNTLPVGCSSLRRTLQFKRLYPNLNIKPVRGNVITRLEKLDKGEYSALILAEAGLIRLGLENRISYRFSLDEMIPAAGQGIIAVQGRKGEFTEILSKLNNPNSMICAKTERYLSQILAGDCTAPIGCFSEVYDDELKLYCFYGVDGVYKKEMIRGNKSDSIQLAEKLAAKIIS